MRTHHVCPRCSHNRILLIAAVADAGEYASELRPLHVAIAKTGEGLFGERLAAAGQLTATVCRACGYTELYTSNPESIPVDGKHVRELVGPAPTDPYR